ncbi:ATP-dependent endopeptidase hsl proteolytic subunit hslV [Bacillus cereus Rock3-42]|nr:ATP-dependent endopeptidase hsl proteolytic subunit hslV [Bacillus cereus Rock3-42]
MGNFHATTIFAVHHNGECAMAGDGQVTMGNAVVMKHTARKVRKLFQGKF